MEEPGLPSTRLAARAAAAGASGALYAAAQPGIGAWPLAAVCLVPLLLALRGAAAPTRIFLGWLAGSVATGVATLPAGTAGASAYFGLSLPAAVAVAAAVGQLFGSGTFAAFTLLAGDPSRQGPIRAALAAAGAFALAELARAALFTGFPWLLLAYALLPVPELAQLASVGGAIAVSALVVLVNAALAELAAAGRSARERRAAALTVALVTAALASGTGAPAGDAAVRPAADARTSGFLRVLLVQHAPALARRSAPSDVRPAVERLRELTAGADFDLAVWSENALPALLPENLHLLRGVLPASGEHALLLGAGHADPERPGGIHISAFLVGAGGEVLGRHDKVRLLPFAERAPWPLSAERLGIVAVVPGTEPRTLRWRAAAVGPLVCYEVLFAGLARRLARDGSGLLVNLSNDAWFAATGAADQHLAAAMYRAIETRRPVLRATHTGITSGIDARGRIVARLPRGAPAALRLDVRPGSGTTPYVRWGDAPLWLFALAAVAAGHLPVRIARDRGRP